MATVTRWKIDYQGQIMPTSIMDYIHFHPAWIVTYIQFSNFPIDWHVLQSLTTAQTAAFETSKYNVHFTPGRPLHWWTAHIWEDFWSSTDAVHTGSISFQSASSHCWVTLVSWSAWFVWVLMSSTSIVCRYSSAASPSLLSQCHINMSDTTFVCTLVFPDNVSETQWCTHAESEPRLPFNIASSSAKLMCLFLCSANMHLQPRINCFLQHHQ